MQINPEVLQKQLPYPIKSLLTIDGTVVAILAYDSIPNSNEETLNRNVYGFHMDGTLKWQIEAVKGGTEREKPFLWIKEINNELVAYNWLGMDYVVNLSNGSLQVHDEPRRPW